MHRRLSSPYYCYPPQLSGQSHRRPGDEDESPRRGDFSTGERRNFGPGSERLLYFPLFLAIALLFFLACSPATAPVAEQPIAMTQSPVETTEDQEERKEEETSLEEEILRAPEPTRYLEEELPPLRVALAATSSWDEFESLVAQIAVVVEKGSDEIGYDELISLEWDLNQEISVKVESLPGRENLSERESCFSSSQCTSGVCGGRGCLPGQWTCTTRPRHDENHTRDMRRACLCSGSNFEGSSTSLRGLRVRKRGSWCAEAAIPR